MVETPNMKPRSPLTGILYNRYTHIHIYTYMYTLDTVGIYIHIYTCLYIYIHLHMMPCIRNFDHGSYTDQASGPTRPHLPAKMSVQRGRGGRGDGRALHTAQV